MDNFAIVKVNGKQYLAQKGEKMIVDHMDEKEGKDIVLKDVLLSSSNKKIAIGTPVIKDAKVEATVVKHLRGPKGMAFRYRPKKNIRVRKGFRADLTELEVKNLKV